ncbi:MAG TPA: hypothetical protein VK978_00070 [Candidatus Saccharimonadales bacterium]|nr:hypothetical protein [Candidatus Saccharimonadales bacterium]
MKQSAQPRNNQYNPALASLSIRIGLALVFAYAAIGGLRDPAAWAGYVPIFATQYVTAATFLMVIGIVQLSLALWLLTGKYVTYAALLAIALLLGIVLSNIPALVITFRDLGLVGAAVALIFLDRPNTKGA